MVIIETIGFAPHEFGKEDESQTIRFLIYFDSHREFKIPNSCGANPMVSIMTMARYQGIRIAGELARYGL